MASRMLKQRGLSTKDQEFSVTGEQQKTQLEHHTTAGLANCVRTLNRRP
jgi:hypothetical protein